jgi:hypothetical protein
LERREEERRRSARGNGQGIGKTQRPRVSEIQLGVGGETLDAMVEGQSAYVSDCILESPAPESQGKGHNAASQGGESQEPWNQGHAGDGSDSGHQFDISGAHAASQPEEEEEDPADKSGESGESQLFPSAEGQMEEQAQQDSGEGDEIRNAAAVHIESSPDHSANKRDRRIQPLGMKVRHAMIPTT